MRFGATSEENAALIGMLRDNPVLGEIADMRATFDAENAQYRLPEGIGERAGLLGERPCLWFEGATSGRVVLWLHGGGYAVGSPTSHRHVASLFAALSGIDVVVADYRLAPEHPFPAAIDDALAAYRALRERYDAGHIAFAGDSAGGGLVVALIGLLPPEEQPACAYCISPWVDLACEADSLAVKADSDPVGSGETLRMLAGLYLGETDPNDPRASPLHAALAAAPPMLIQVGSCEVLLDDSLRLARVLGLADRSVRLEIWRDMIHDWPLYFPALPEGREALAAGAAFVAEAFA